MCPSPRSSPWAFAQQLYEARRSRVPIDAFTDALPDLGMVDGYAIQQHLVQRLLDDGEVIVGYKLGLTSLPMQQLLGVDSPDFGPVFASGVFATARSCRWTGSSHPRVEAEIGVILGSDLSGPHCTPADALRATEGWSRRWRSSTPGSGTGRSSWRTRWRTWPATARSR